MSAPPGPAAEKRRPQVVAADEEMLTGLGRVGQWVEVAIYLVGGAFLVAAAAIVLLDAIPLLWSGDPSKRALAILDHILLAFVLIEVFHTVRLAIALHELQAEPFLVVALIAAVRRILVITAGNEPLVNRDTLVELGLLVTLLLVSAAALLMLRSRRGR